MKVSYIHIQNYKQFSNLELELIYPKGHKKAGEPLDKICIIGQSGTGKTNLLDIIKKSSLDFSSQYNYLPFSEFTGNENDNRYITTNFKLANRLNAETLFTEDDSKISFDKEIDSESPYKTLDNEKVYFVSTDRCGVEEKEEKETEEEFDINKMSAADRRIYDKLQEKRVELKIKSIEKSPYVMQSEQIRSSLDRALRSTGIYYDYSVLSDRQKERELNKEINRLENKYSTINKTIKKIEKDNFINKFIININESNNSWKALKENIDSYESSRDEFIKKLHNKLLNDDNYTKEEYKQDIKSWEEENENVLNKIASDINTIIKKFNLELKINEDTQNYEELIIKDLSNGNELKYDNLSTGTKNLLSTFIPLKSYKPKESIILIDEPEMSFYPDIQKQLVELYKGVGCDNQLIIATHSPIVSSGFEPWEVVELKFDKNNQIYREKYYEDENHIDNYKVDPRMLTWTGILTDVFDMQEDSNFSFREKKLMEYATLKSEIKAMQNKESKEAQEKISKFKKLSQLLGLNN
jgi:ABC-type lipoprotein export system ATPase subunit